MNQGGKIESEYQEIDLMDYVVVILKRKWLIFGIFLIFVIITGVYSYFIAKKVYKIDTSLEVGKIGEKVIEEPTQVKEKVDADAYGVFIQEKLGISEVDFPKIKTKNPKNTKLILMEINSTKTQGTKNILEELNNLILTEHQEKIRVQKELMENNIKTTEDKIKLVESDIEKINNKIKITESDIEKTKNKIKPIEADIERITNKIEFTEEEKENLEAKVDALQKVLPYQQDPGTQFALFDTKEKLANKKQEIEDLYSRINSLNISIEDLNLTINSLEKTKEDYNSGINSLKASIEDLNSQINSLKASLDDIKPTKIVKSPTISEKQIRPRPVSNTGIAGLLGLFIGVFLAFGKEWWQKSKIR